MWLGITVLSVYMLNEQTSPRLLSEIRQDFKGNIICCFKFGYFSPLICEINLECVCIYELLAWAEEATAPAS